MINLLIDAGNSRLKWGLNVVSPSSVATSPSGRNPDHRLTNDWLAKGFVLTDDALSLPGQLLAVLSTAGEINRVVACSVAGEAVDTVIAATLPNGLADRLEWFRSGEEVRCGLINRYAVRSRLGSDRWAAAIGAWRRVGGDCLVVTSGTATTIDVVRALKAPDQRTFAEAEFAGGVILPGMRLMQSSLVSNTAQLRETDGGMIELPVTTEDAITSGCLEAQLGAIDRMRRRLPAGSPVVLSGGAAPKLAPWLAGMIIPVDDLVLDGLAVVAKES